MRRLLVLPLLAVAALTITAAPAGASTPSSGFSPRAPFGQISVGPTATCAIDATSRARCWGNNTSGQRDVPPDLGPVSQIAMAASSACALTIAGPVRCWGNPSFGQLTPPSDLEPVRQLSSVNAGFCAVTLAGQVRCWGSVPTVPADLGAVREISTGGDAGFCAVRDIGTVRCWGASNRGQTDVPGDLGPVLNVATDGYTVCAVKINGAPVCWGDAATRLAPPPTSVRCSRSRPARIRRARSRLLAPCAAGGTRAGRLPVTWVQSSTSERRTTRAAPSPPTGHFAAGAAMGSCRPRRPTTSARCRCRLWWLASRGVWHQHRWHGALLGPGGVDFAACTGRPRGGA